ncbi:MAG TPA: hypothetical protein VK845_15250 [Gemmatimonadales bacterium]|nr:hypothetical protein [Gemmatimonadales bacterium]
MNSTTATTATITAHLTHRMTGPSLGSDSKMARQDLWQTPDGELEWREPAPPKCAWSKDVTPDELATAFGAQVLTGTRRVR